LLCLLVSVICYSAGSSSSRKRYTGQHKHAEKIASLIVCSTNRRNAEIRCKDCNHKCSVAVMYSRLSC